MRPGCGRRAAAAGSFALAAWAAVATGLAAQPAAAQAPASFKVTLLAPADDPRLERGRLERGWLNQPGGPAADGLKLALEEARFELEAAGAKLELNVVEVADAAAARAAAAAAEKAGAAALVADLPSPWLLAAADAARALPVLNVGDSRDALRGPECRANLWHTPPSERMRADALAQTLAARRWTNVLLLAGPGAADAERAATVQAAIRRYGLKLAASKPFKLSADPRERDLANPLLLTGTATVAAYDVVWVVDADGEFATLLPYRTALPRPVVGDGGLVPVAWSARAERFGAPQVNRRFARAAKRPMTAADWSAWIAGKALAAAAVGAQQVRPAAAGTTAPAAPRGTPAAFRSAFAAVEVDGSKGTPLSFRAWDGQLRQTVLLTDGQAVIAQAPVDGILHPRNTLDTLGADAPEKPCAARAAR